MDPVRKGEAIVITVSKLAGLMSGGIVLTALLGGCSGAPESHLVLGDSSILEEDGGSDGMSIGPDTPGVEDAAGAELSAADFLPEARAVDDADSVLPPETVPDTGPQPCTQDSDCPDGLHCLTDAGTCVECVEYSHCDDATPCTFDFCDQTNVCIHKPVDAQCDDGNSCSLGDHCAEGVCVADTLIDCSDGNACTDDLCTGTGCDHPFNAAPCDDGDPCTTGDACAEGFCAPGPEPTPCSDGNPCTDDSCDPGSGGCTFPPNQAPCDDGNPCTLGDSCQAGQCQPGTQQAWCDDGNPCTQDSCTPGAGCTYTPQPGIGCNDGNACTTGDACNWSGACTGNSLNCDDGNPCTNDWCNPGNGCHNDAANGGWCDDGDPCTSGDTCNWGWCGGNPMNCNDNNDCTQDECSGGTCYHAQIPGCGEPTCKGSNCGFTQNAPCQCDSACKQYGDCCDDVCIYCGHQFCNCNPNCEGKSCGGDGCGGSCGQCPQGTHCDWWGKCQPCTCQGKVCGNDGCGISCGQCPPNQWCSSGQCVGW
jgi:hypothetical protein